ncbi:MAG: LytTR family transcriptional regulator [Clostridia bacterium]|nr:LytTR family transcriptional regulator [Clostridia bacterium]
MNIKVRTNISNEYENIEIVINAPEKTTQVLDIENDLLRISSNTIEKVIGMQGNDIFIINVSDVITFYSEEKSNFCKTKDGIFKIKEKLYYLEENLLQKSFIRISNSVIVNIDKVKCFNTDIIGSILVKLNDGTEEYVSKRRVSDVMKFLKNRRD